ncbi:MAG: type II toxin-antitoxin system HigB family toxin [Parachlamydia sp.]|nr:type II toxin-antitoxin system HigB family toxin [Parachlamydia sp.]
MRIITKRALTQSWMKYPEARQSLGIWEERIKEASFKNHGELKRVFPDADYIPNPKFKHLTMFNIKGSDFRLAVDIFFNSGHVYIKWFGKHAAYDRINFDLVSNGGFILC